MITEEQIKNLSNKLQTADLNIRREYFQHLFLSYFYQQPQTDAIYFKGGTALRLVHQSPRFSEDLDFSSTLNSIMPIEQAIIQTLTLIQKENIKTELLESKSTSGGYLANISFAAYERNITVKLQISLREGKKKGEAVVISSDFIPPYIVIRLLQEQLVDEKIKALLHRQKPRDFYDLYFILRSNLLPPQKKDILSQILKTLNKVDINFEKELKLFLPKSHWAIIRNFKQTLEQEINRFV